jgi:nucleoside 2-deoxyribosyltransferase
MSGLSVYLAAPYAARDAIRGYADELERIGMTVTSTWLHEQTELGSGTTGAATALGDEQVKRHCLDDFADIRNADALVLFTESAAAALMAGGTATSGGRHVETGYALAKDKHVVIVGAPENVFHRGVCDQVEDWHDAVLHLVRLEKALHRSRNMVVAG